MEIVNIKDINNRKIRGKALGLKKLIEYKVPVPEAFVIDSDFIEELLSENIDSITKIY